MFGYPRSSATYCFPLQRCRYPSLDKSHTTRIADVLPIVNLVNEVRLVEIFNIQTFEISITQTEFHLDYT